MSIVELSLKLFFDEEIKFRSFSGYVAQGLMYRLIQEANRELSAIYHDSSTIKPFATSALEIESSSGKKVVYKRVPSESTGFLKFTFLGKKIPELLFSVIKDGLDSVWMENKRVKVLEVFVNFIGFDEILSESRAVNKFKIHFKTPTFFRLPISSCCPDCPEYRKYLEIGRNRKICPFMIRRPRGLYVPLPMPTLMISNLIRVWNKFSPNPLDRKWLIDWVDGGGVILAGFPSGIKTVKVFKSENEFNVGFIGTVNYNVTDQLFDERKVKVLDALLRFAEYSNVGGGRTAGFGVVEYKPKYGD